MSASKHLLCALTLTLVTLWSGSASADLAPPSGIKNVGYSVKIENVAAFPDHVLIAYPWSLSNGAPTQEHKVIGAEEPLRIGRRSPTTKLYAMNRAAYETWRKDYTAPEDNFEDPALDALVKRSDVVLCNQAPNARHSLSEDDARSRIVDVLRVVSLTDTTCDLTIVSAAPPSPGAAGGCASCQAAGPVDELPHLPMVVVFLGVIAALARREAR